MSRTDWNEMSPRERDALVATEVMGWTECDAHEKHTDGLEYQYGWGRNRGAGKHLIPDYTTSVSAAWEVVEKMREEGFYPDLVSTFGDAFGWYVQLHAPHLDAPIICPFTESAPEAICVAALRAKGVEV